MSNTVQGSTTLKKHYTYYDTGMVKTATDVNGAVTTYNYPDATSTCGNAFATSFILPVVGTTPTTIFNCNGAVATTVRDLNGNTTTVSYTDANFWRPHSSTDPVGALTQYAYYGTTSTEAYMFFGSNSIADQLTTVDSFGRPIISQQQEAPAGGGSPVFDSTQTNYDSVGRPYQQTMPYVGSQSQSAPAGTPVTTTSYDALGRVTEVQDGGNPTPGWIQYTYTQNDVLQVVGPAPSNENSKQKQLEYDALGRLTSVCEITQNASPNTCGQIGGNQNGYVTTYTYGVNSSGYPYTKVTQGPSGSQQTRTYTYDLMGRMLSEVNPENGTTTYTYDSDSAGTCSGTYTGDLVKLTDAKGNKICYQYDAIHRNTQITYPSGPDAGNTPSKTFVYDSASYNGTAMLNPKGRLVEAYTGSSGSKTTDEFFQYSVRGELTDTWECTPHSGTNGCASVSNYYKVTAGFWENGRLKSLSSNISGLPTQTYGVDSMGRTSTVSASSGQNPVTGTSYNLSTFTYGVTFGSGDSDTFTMDQYTGRQKQYQFTVNGVTNTGVTTWNPNGSLQSLNITDHISGTADTQNCSYTHDDLARIASVSCTNGSTNLWNQQFSYDAFGNVTKNSSGPGGVFQPTYSASTNWMTALPGVTPTYDSNGRLTYDGTHNYAWDVEGKLYTVDSTTLTHDALGRTVEKAVSGSYTQIVYGPLANKFAVMNGPTLVKAYVPLPAAQAVYTSSGLTYYRHRDHLGSSRLATTPTRTLYSSTAYSPYGESYAQAGTTDLSFTGQEQGTISGIYDFMFRHYNPAHSRWLSPDPAGLGAVDPANPQTWNRYAYVMNNPMSLVDPLGLYCGWDDETYDANPEDGGASQSECEAQGGTWYDGDSPNHDPIVVPGETVNVTATVDPLDPEPPLVINFPVTPFPPGILSGTPAIPRLAPNNVCSEDGPHIVRDASVNALSRLNPGQDESQNITPRDGNFANVLNPSLINTTSWTSAASAHGTSQESPTIPGQSIFVVKLYNDPGRGDIIAVVYPNGTLKHMTGLIPFLAGSTSVNVPAARAYMGCP